MKLATPISTCADLSETSLQDAWEQCHKPEHWSLIVGTENVSLGRILKGQGKTPWVFVNPEWTKEWMVSSQWANCFSEGV